MIINKSFVSFHILEPSSEEKKRHSASTFRKKEKKEEIEEIKEKLKQIRRKTRDNIDLFIERFKLSLQEWEGIHVYYASTAEEAVKVINEASNHTKHVSINKSSVVVNEIRPLLTDCGFRTYIRYFSEFTNFNPANFTISDYWMLPGFRERGIMATFETKKVIGFPSGKPLKEYIAVLGVNAASADDGNLFFLQHMSNISEDLLEAKKIFFVVPVEKILENTVEAKLHTQAMGIFGLEAVLLDLKPKEKEIFHFNTLPLYKDMKEIHIIIYDNGRKNLLNTAFSDLLLCIDCRACAAQCPVGVHLFSDKDFIYSPKNILFLHLQGKIPPFESCLHCGRCELECPLGIEIPKLLWKAQIQYYKKRNRGLKKILLDNPELLAKMGTLFSPLSNRLLKMDSVRIIMEIISGIHRHAALPSFKRNTFTKFLKEAKLRG